MSDETITGKLDFIIEVLKDLQARQKSMDARQVEINPMPGGLGAAGGNEQMLGLGAAAGGGMQRRSREILAAPSNK